MDDQHDSVSIQLPQTVTIDSLTLGTTIKHITIRLMRMWEARNFKQNRKLVSLDILLVYTKDCIIGSIHHRRVPHFKSLLKEGQVYIINNLEVIPAYERFKVAHNKVSQRFMDITEVTKEKSKLCPIKVEIFRLLTYLEDLALENTNLQLPGKILSVQGSNLHDIDSTQMIT